MSVTTKKQYRNTIKKINEIIMKYDPAGIRGELTELASIDDFLHDQYDPKVNYYREADTIISCCQSARSADDLVVAFHEHFGFWFRDDLNNGENWHLSMAEDIWTEWKAIAGKN